MKGSDMLVFVLALILIGGGVYLIYFFGTSFSGEHQQGEEHDKTEELSGGAKVIVDYLENPERKNISITYEHKMDNEERKETITYGENWKSVKFSTPISNLTIYLGNNKEYACIESDEGAACSSNFTNKKKIAEAKIISGDREFLKKESEVLKKLIEFGAVKFSEPEIKTVSGKECESVSYSISFGNMTAGQLAAIGKNPNYGIQLPLYKRTACIWEGILLSEEVEYETPVRGTVREIRVASETSENSKIEPPKEFDNEKFDELYGHAKETESVILKCFSRSDKEDCVLVNAKDKEDPKLCRYAGEKADFCNLVIAQTTKNEEVCEGIEDKQKRDSCINDVAILKEDAGICNTIENETLKKECESSIQK